MNVEYAVYVREMFSLCHVRSMFRLSSVIKCCYVYLKTRRCGATSAAFTTRHTSSRTFRYTAATDLKTSMIRGMQRMMVRISRRSLELFATSMNERMDADQRRFIPPT